MTRFHDPMALLFAIDKHRVAGIVVVVIGALVATYGVLRALKRVSGAALIALSGVAIAVVGILVSTHTIHG